MKTIKNHKNKITKFLQKNKKLSISIFFISVILMFFIFQTKASFSSSATPGCGYISTTITPNYITDSSTNNVTVKINVDTDCVGVSRSSSTIIDSVPAGLSSSSGGVYSGVSSLPNGTYTFNVDTTFTGCISGGGVNCITPPDVADSASFTIARPSCPATNIAGVNGVNGARGETTTVYTDDTYLTVYGTFSASGNSTNLGSIAYESTGQMNISVGSLSAGSHSISITNNCGNSSSSSFNVVTPSPTGSISVSPASCTAPCNVTISGSANNLPSIPGNGQEIRMVGSAGTRFTGGQAYSGSSFSDTDSALPVGTYTYTLYGYNADWSLTSSLGTATVTVTAPTCSISTFSCANDTLTWSTSSCTTHSISPGNYSTATGNVSNAASGTYTLTVDSSANPNTSTATCNLPPIVHVNASNVQLTSGQSSASIPFTISNSGGFGSSLLLNGSGCSYAPSGNISIVPGSGNCPSGSL